MQTLCISTLLTKTFKPIRRNRWLLHIAHIYLSNAERIRWPFTECLNSRIMCCDLCRLQATAIIRVSKPEQKPVLSSRFDKYEIISTERSRLNVVFTYGAYRQSTYLVHQNIHVFRLHSNKYSLRIWMFCYILHLFQYMFNHLIFGHFCIYRCISLFKWPRSQ